MTVFSRTIYPTVILMLKVPPLCLFADLENDLSFIYCFQALKKKMCSYFAKLCCQMLLKVKTVHACPLTSNLCAEVWKTRYECSLNPGNENSKLEMETPKFSAKIDFNFHWKVQAFKLTLQTSDQIFCFRF